MATFLITLALFTAGLADPNQLKANFTKPSSPTHASRGATPNATAGHTAKALAASTKRFHASFLTPPSSSGKNVTRSTKKIISSDSIGPINLTSNAAHSQLMLDQRSNHLLGDWVLSFFDCHEQICTTNQALRLLLAIILVAVTVGILIARCCCGCTFIDAWYDCYEGFVVVASALRENHDKTKVVAGPKKRLSNIPKLGEKPVFETVPSHSPPPSSPPSSPPW